MPPIGEAAPGWRGAHQGWGWGAVLGRVPRPPREKAREERPAAGDRGLPVTPRPLPHSFVLTQEQKRYFEKLVIYCDQYASLIPVSFVLGAFALLNSPLPRS